jgi:hypothetical protein
MTTFVLTVLGGVLIFVVGQIVLKLVIEPAQELKRSLGSTSHALLLHQAKLTNASSDKEIAAEMKSLSAEIVSKSHAVLWYAFVRIVFGLPSKKNILMASRQLNSISYGVLEESKKFEDSSNFNAKKTDFALENTTAIVEVGRLLGLKTTYRDSY